MLRSKYSSLRSVQAWLAAVNGAVALYKLAGEKRLPGLEKAVYLGEGEPAGGGDTQLKLSVFGAAVAIALSGEAASDER